MPACKTTGGMTEEGVTTTTLLGLETSTMDGTTTARPSMLRAFAARLTRGRRRAIGRRNSPLRTAAGASSGNADAAIQMDGWSGQKNEIRV